MTIRDDDFPAQLLGKLDGLFDVLVGVARSSHRLDILDRVLTRVKHTKSSRKGRIVEGA